VGNLLSFYLSGKSAPHPEGQVWVYNFHNCLRLRFRGGYSGRADMIAVGRHGQKLNLVDVLKDKEVTHKMGILGFWGN
jgi:hypothetical protein